MDIPVRRLALGGILAMAVGMGIGRFVYTPLLPSMMHELGLTASQAGLIASANFVGYLLGAILASGRWAAMRERQMVIGSLLATALLAAAMGMTDNVVAFILIRFAAGMASAFNLIFLATILFSQYAAAGRQDLGAVHFGGVGFGIAVSSVMTAWIYLAGNSWQSGWYWSGALSLAGALAVWRLVDRGAIGNGSGREAEPSLRFSLPLSRVVAAYTLFGFGYVITATFLVAIVRSGDGSPLSEPLVWLVTGLVAMATTGFWMRAGNRIGLARAFALALILEAAGVVASVSIPGLAGPLIGGAALGGTFIAITAYGLQMGRALAGASPRRVMASMTAMFGIGQIIGPVVAGWLADWSGDYFMASLAAAVALLAGGLITPMGKVPAAS